MLRFQILMAGVVLASVQPAEPIWAQDVQNGAVTERPLSNKQKVEQARNLSEEAYAAYERGDTELADLKFAESLEFYRDAFGERHPETVLNLYSYALFLGILNRDAEAEPLLEESLRLNREIYGEEHPDTLAVGLHYAIVLDKLDQTEAAIPYAKKTADIRRKTLGEQHPDTIKSMDVFVKLVDGLNLVELDRLEEIEIYYADLLEYRTRVLGERDPKTLKTLNQYGFVLQNLGKYREAEPILKNALDLHSETLGDRHGETLSSLNNYALVLAYLGRFDQARLLLARALKYNRNTLGQIDQDAVSVLASYASMLSALGRGKEAEPLFVEALRIRRIAKNRQPGELPGTLGPYANLLLDLGRVDEAIPLFQEAFETSRVELGDAHPDTFRHLSNYSTALGRAGRETDAVAVLAKLDRSWAELDEKHPGAIGLMQNRAIKLANSENLTAAEPLFLKVVELRKDTVGQHHPRTLDAQSNLVEIRLRSAQTSSFALAPARQLLAGARKLRGRELGRLNAQLRLSPERQNRARYFHSFANAAWQSGDRVGTDVRSAGDRTQLPREVYGALQDSLHSTSSRAVARTTAKRAAAMKGLGDEIGRREALLDELGAADVALSRAFARSDQSAEAAQDTLQNRLVEIREEIAEIDAKIRQKSPDYFALIAPSFLTLEQTQKMLRPSEAILLLVPSGRGTHIMTVSDSGLTWHRSAATEAEIDAAVKRLIWDVGGTVDISQIEQAEWQDEGEGADPFDFKTAHYLYRELIQPVVDSLDGKSHIFVSAAGSLAQLPLGIFVEEIPDGANGDAEVQRQAKWLADRFAISVVPSPQSLFFIRNYRVNNQSAAKPYLGFGDPVLEGEAASRGARRGNDRNQASFKGMFGSNFSANGDALASTDALRKLARLPGTREEIVAQAKAFGAKEDSVFLNERASETIVRNTKLDATVISFATHGLLAGEIDGVAEPGLVLTPPRKGSVSDDGYLTASEISALNINADWVLLSACSTAGGGNTPGLSGLARSFFFAGATNLLVSHWPVRDDVAARLTIRAIELKQQNEDLSRAQAMQMAVREIRNNRSDSGEGGSWAHPAAWAPFSIVGDGAR